MILQLKFLLMVKRKLSRIDAEGYSNQIESISNLLIDGRFQSKSGFNFEEIYKNNELLEKWVQF